MSEIEFEVVERRFLPNRNGHKAASLRPIAEALLREPGKAIRFECDISKSWLASALWRHLVKLLEKAGQLRIGPDGQNYSLTVHVRDLTTVKGGKRAYQVSADW